MYGWSARGNELRGRMSYKVSNSYPDSIPPADQPYIASQYKQDLQSNIAMATNNEQQRQQQPQQQQQWINHPTVENSDLKEKMNCKNTLNEYIFDFLTKSSLKDTAAAFAQDAQLDRDIGHEPVDGPNPCLLYTSRCV